MIVDVNAQKRMVLNKFRNRPPFNLKCKDRSKLSTQVEGKSTSASQTTAVIKPKMLPVPVGRNRPASSNVIPKVIESFQKVTPKPALDFIESSNDSIQTLYRNSAPNIGNQIPDHVLMKSLLENLNTSTKKRFQVVDMAPNKEPNVKCRVVMKKPQKRKNLPKVNKATSTTGLVWPVLLETGKEDRTDFRRRSRIPRRKKIDITVETFTGNETSREKITSMDNIIPKVKSQYIPRMNASDYSFPGSRCPNCCCSSSLNTSTHDDIESKFGKIEAVEVSKRPTKEKSFVLAQVAKFDSLYQRAPKKFANVKKRPTEKFAYPYPIKVR